MKKLALALFLLAPSLSMAQVQYLRNLGNFTDGTEPSCTSATKGFWYYNTTNNYLKCCEGSGPTWNLCGSAGTGTAGRCAYWSTASTLAADEGCAYNSSTNTLTISPADGGVGIVLNGQNTKVDVGKWFHVDTSGHVLSAAGTFVTDGGLAYSATTDPGTGWGVDAPNHLIGFQSGLNRTFNLDTVGFWPETSALFSVDTVSTQYTPAAMESYAFKTPTNKPYFIVPGGVWYCNGGSNADSCVSTSNSSHGYTPYYNSDYPGAAPSGIRVASNPAVNSGRPVIAYFTASPFTLKTRYCTADDCSTVSAEHSVKVIEAWAGYSADPFGIGACGDGSVMVVWKEITTTGVCSSDNAACTVDGDCTLGDGGVVPAGTCRRERTFYTRCTDATCSSSATYDIVNAVPSLDNAYNAGIGGIANVFCGNTGSSYFPVFEFSGKRTRYMDDASPFVVTCQNMTCSGERTVSEFNDSYNTNPGGRMAQSKFNGVTYFSHRMTFGSRSAAYLLACTTNSCSTLTSLYGNTAISSASNGCSGGDYNQTANQNVNIIPYATDFANIAYLAVISCGNTGEYSITANYCRDSLCAPAFRSSYDITQYTLNVGVIQPFGVSVVELPSGDLRILNGYRYRAYEGAFLDAIDVGIGTQTPHGASIGKTTNKVANVYVAANVETGNLKITGGGFGYGFLTLGMLPADPVGSFTEGTMFWQSVDNQCRIYNGLSWQNCAVGLTDLLIGGNAYAGSISVGTMTGYNYPVSLRAGGHDYVTASPDGGVTVDITDGGTNGSFRVTNKGNEEMKVTPDGGVGTPKLRLLEQAGTDYITVTAPTGMSAPWKLTLPTGAAGATGAVLTASSSTGDLAWSSTAVGTINLTGGTGTSTVPSGSVCVCSDQTSVAAVQCSVATTTLTANGTGTDAISFFCKVP